MSVVSFLIASVCFVFGAPLLGGFLAGVDRKITARLQNRVGPPLLQPFFDVRKLFAKESRDVNGYQGFYVLMSLVFAVFAGVFFFAGGNFLLVVFILTLSTLFFIVAAYSTRSPYAEIGAEREIIQVMSYEPMVILLCVAYYLAVGSFNVSAAIELERPVILTLPLVFVGLLFILTIKLRKSPFDLSYSHHAHQELVKGISTEMSGRTLALVELMHWYENVLFFGWIGIFFFWGSWLAAPVVVLAVVLVYFLEIFIDNNFARVKWHTMLKWSWVVTLVCYAINITALRFHWLG
ncbi:MAG: NADH-quinone oxidoreductase subunit H [Coriobacteriales bacterium]|jgi:ech hydrogenase subunit B|nr:NADH-quinone oxidoreductase subunit H [Coriobacteriales bacterium]